MHTNNVKKNVPITPANQNAHQWMTYTICKSFSWIIRVFSLHELLFIYISTNSKMATDDRSGKISSLFSDSLNKYTMFVMIQWIYFQCYSNLQILHFKQMGPAVGSLSLIFINVHDWTFSVFQQHYDYTFLLFDHLWNHFIKIFLLLL